MDKIIKFHWFQQHQTHELEEKLEQNAARGLHFEKVGKLGWIYRKGEPKQVHYSIVFYPKGDQFNWEVPEDQQTYYDFCRADGWEIVDQWGAMLIFVNQRENPTPIETDEGEKLENIHKLSKKKLIFGNLFITALMALQLVIQWDMVTDDWIFSLSNVASMALIPAFLALIVAELLMVFSYFRWYHQSKISVAQGGACIRRRSNKIINLLLALALVFLVLSLGQFGDNWMVFAATIAHIPLLILLLNLIMKLLKKCKIGRKPSKIIAYSTLIILSCGYAIGLSALLLSHTVSPVEIDAERFPITAQELHQTADSEDYEYRTEIQLSPLLSAAEYTQFLWGTEDLPDLSYGIYRTELPWVYDTVFNQLTALQDWDDRFWTEVDPSPWGANRLLIMDENYIVCYDAAILSVNAEAELTQDEIANFLAALSFS